jgi:hypothetical protein
VGRQKQGVQGTGFDEAGAVVVGTEQESWGRLEKDRANRQRRMSRKVRGSRLGTGIERAGWAGIGQKEQGN